jgi:hypothetical protein
VSVDLAAADPPQIVLRTSPYGDGPATGRSLGGGNYVGLVDGNVTDFDGCWELEGHLPALPAHPDDSESGLSGDADPLLVAAAARRRRRRLAVDRRQHMMALHDAGGGDGRGEVRTPRLLCQLPVYDEQNMY